jgi:purine-binding chemotaxis protein CheW
MPEFIKGVINLRGKVIPILDVRKRFHLPEVGYDDRTCIIVVTMLDTTIGMVVDEVSEVIDIPSDKVDPAPKTSKHTQSRYIQGIGKIGDNVKIILNIDRILTDEELSGMQEL